MQMSYTLVMYRLPKIYQHRLQFFLYAYHNKTLHNGSLHEK